MKSALWRGLMRRKGLAGIAGIALVVSMGTTAVAKGFVPGCELPFKDIAVKQSIDNICPIGGAAKGGAQLAQDQAKNNFCATGDPVTVTFDTFSQLQSAAEAANIPFGMGMHLPPDRSLLKDLVEVGSPPVKIGEGSVVRLVAFIVEAHHSNVSKGESVNCKKHGKAYNDIHIVLGQTADADPCDSVTAEISPHYRPTSWDGLETYDLSTRPVRMTGQLFFDASHKPCSAGKRASPPRMAIWEIHPVYALDVCKKNALADCKADDDTVWVPLDQWLGLEEESP